MRGSQFITALLTLLLSIMLSQHLWAGQAEQLFCEALYQEIGLGNLEAAIAAYEKVIAGHSDNAAIAAKALLRIGLCAEKLGRTKEALKTYNKLITDYPNQPEAEQARKRLEALGAKREGEKISQAVRLEHRSTNSEINKYRVQVKILSGVALNQNVVDVSADMKFLLETVTKGSVSAKISDCSLKLFVNEKEKVNTQSWLPLEKAGGKGNIDRYKGARVSGADLMAGLESYLKKDYGVQITLADIISTAWIGFPEEELQPGQFWFNSLQRFSPERLITKYTLSGIKRYKNRDCAVITSSSEQKAFAVSIGDSKEMDYQLTESGTIYWEYQLGALVECKTDVEIKGEIRHSVGNEKRIIANTGLKISLLIERVGPDRRYSSPENTLRELIDALNKKDKERYSVCFARDYQQSFQKFPEAQDFLDSYFRMPGTLMIGYTIPSYEIRGFDDKENYLEVRQTVKFDYNGETKDEEKYYFLREGDKWLLEPFPLMDSSRYFKLRLRELGIALEFLIEAINKRDLLLWFQCMASPVRNKLAKMEPAELQDYFNKQWFPSQITDYSIGKQYRASLSEEDAMFGNAENFAVDWIKRTFPNEREVLGTTRCTMVVDGGSWWVLKLETFDLSISPKDISLTRAEDGRLLIAVKMHNNGNVSVADVDVKFFLGNPEEGGTLIGQGGLAIEPNSSAVEAIPWDVGDGEYEVFVIVDPDDKIKEINEENNRASKVVKVAE